MHAKGVHIVDESTVLELFERKSGKSLRVLAVELGLPKCACAMLSGVLRRQPSSLSAVGEADLRRRLGLLSSTARPRRRYIRPCLSTDPAVRVAQLRELLRQAEEGT